MSLPLTIFDLFGPMRGYDVAAFTWTEESVPVAVRITARSLDERNRALEAIKNSPTSFVVYAGHRYSPGQQPVPYDPARPACVDELDLLFDVEPLGPGSDGQPCVYLFTHAEQQFALARAAMKHLRQLGLVSSESYLQCNAGGSLQGISAAALDGEPERGALVNLRRELTYQRHNG